MRRDSQHGNVWRTVRRARAAGDGVHLVVRGRRGVPLRPHLPARRRPHLLFRPGPRDLSDLPPCRCPHDPAQRRATGRTIRPSRGRRSTTRRTCRSTRPRSRWSRKVRGCMPTAKPGCGSDAEAAPAWHRRHRRPPHRRVRGDPRMQDRRLRRRRTRPRQDICRGKRHRPRLRRARCGDRLGRVRRRHQLHAGWRAHGDDAGADCRRQARLLRKAAGAQLCTTPSP